MAPKREGGRRGGISRGAFEGTAGTETAGLENCSNDAATRAASAGSLQSAASANVLLAQPDVDMASPSELAVVWVEKARKGSVQWFDTMPEAQMKSYRLRKQIKPVVHLVMFLYLAMALFEQPSWCLGDKNPCANSNAFGDMPSSGLPVLPFQVSNSLEIFFLFILSLRTWQRWKSLAGEFTFTGANKYWNIVLIVVLALSILDCVVGIFNIKGIIPGNFRLARLCRPVVFMCCYKHLRQAVQRTALSVPKFMSVLISLAMCVFCYTWVGIILFAGEPEGRGHFHSWAEAFASMWVLFTTANNPDVWLPAYQTSRWSFVFFFSYLIISLYLINNVLLAAVYEAYKDELKASVRCFYKNRKIAIQHAFDLLAVDYGGGDKRIGEHRWGVFFSTFCDSRYGGVSMPGTDAENVKKGRLAFTALDVDQTMGISFDEFRLVADILHDTTAMAPKHKKIVIHNRLLRRMRNSMLHDHHSPPGCSLRWDAAVDVLIFIDIVLTFVCTVIFMDEMDAGHYIADSVWRRDGPWFYIAFSITSIYFLETNFKVWLLGRHRFWNHKKFMHRFDLPNVYVLMGLQLAYMFTSHVTDNMVRLYILCRLARLLRLLYHVESLRNLFHVMAQLGPTYRRLTFMLLIVFYFYATIGEQVFGGLVRNNAETASKLEGSGFAEDGYYDLNFNDFLSGMVVLFILLIVNNWFVISDGFLRLTGTAWSQVFFITFFVVTNLIVLNILMALILDCFATLRDDLEKIEARKKAEREAQDTADDDDEDRDSEAEDDEDEDEDDRTTRAASARHHAASSTRFRRESVLRRVLLGDEQEDDDDAVSPSGRSRTVSGGVSLNVNMND